jgi:hypothetical protein
LALTFEMTWFPWDGILPLAIASSISAISLLYTDGDDTMQRNVALIAVAVVSDPAALRPCQYV